MKVKRYTLITLIESTGFHIWRSEGEGGEPYAYKLEAVDLYSIVDIITSRFGIR